MIQSITLSEKPSMRVQPPLPTPRGYVNDFAGVVAAVEGAIGALE